MSFSVPSSRFFIMSDSSALLFFAEHANNEGITVLLLEGTTMQIYLPEKMSKETIEEILVQLERRQNYEFFMAINGSVASIPNYNELGLEEGFKP